MTRFLTPLLILGLALVSFFYFTTPVLTKIDDLKIERAKLIVALDNATKLKDKQKELLDLRNAMDPVDLADLKQLLPDNIDNVRLIIDINNIAKRRGLIVRNPGIVKDADEGGGSGSNQLVAAASDRPSGGSQSGLGKSSVVISFSVSASYEIFKLFLEDLEHSLRIVDIESVSFSGNDKNLYDYKISLRTYWLK